jgi:hypothetical protein
MLETTDVTVDVKGRTGWRRSVAEYSDRRRIICSRPEPLLAHCRMIRGGANHPSVNWHLVIPPILLLICASACFPMHSTSTVNGTVCTSDGWATPVGASIKSQCVSPDGKPVTNSEVHSGIM